MEQEQINQEVNLEETEVETPQPLLSICVISSTEDKETRLKTFIEYLPKSTEIELVFVETISREFQKRIKNKVIRNEINLVQGEYYYYEPILNFAEARNYSLSLAKGKWIMILDMDEYFPSILLASLFSILRKYENSKYMGLMIGVSSSGRNFKEEIYDRIHTSTVRIFRNVPIIKYYGYVHETIEHVLLGDNILETGLSINHYGYDVDIDTVLKKFERNIRGLCKMEYDNNYPNDRIKEYYRTYLESSIQAFNELKEIKNKK